VGEGLVPTGHWGPHGLVDRPGRQNRLRHGFRPPECGIPSCQNKTDSARQAAAITLFSLAKGKFVPILAYRAGLVIVDRRCPDV